MMLKLQAKPAVLAACAAMLLSGCSVLEDNKIDYKSAGKGPSLEVPPDLTQLSRDTRYNVPGGSVSASAFQTGQPGASTPTAPAALGDVRVERVGNQRYLLVNRPPEQLYNLVRDFWQENGFILTQDTAATGIMETDWAENRAKIPQDFIRNTLGKLLDSLYSTSERDRFRTRLDRTPTGGTEIYITHRGMQEVYTSAQRDRTMWTPRPSDPELENEFMRRLMVKLGLPAEQSRAIVAAGSSAPAKATSRVITAGGAPAVQVDDGFDRAWRRVGLTLDRTGFTVEDRDRSQGMYFVRYVEPSADRKEQGFLSRIFGTDNVPPPVRYRINVKADGATSTVTVLNAAGQPETSQAAQRIVQVIADDLK